MDPVPSSDTASVLPYETPVDDPSLGRPTANWQLSSSSEGELGIEAEVSGRGRKEKRESEG